MRQGKQSVRDLMSRIRQFGNGLLSTAFPRQLSGRLSARAIPIFLMPRRLNAFTTQRVNRNGTSLDLMRRRRVLFVASALTMGLIGDRRDGPKRPKLAKTAIK